MQAGGFLKRTIHISFNFILSFVVIIIGAIVFFSALDTEMHINRADEVNDFGTGQIKEGFCLQGELNSYLVNETSNSGVLGIITTFQDDMNVYAIKTSDEKYITLIVKEPESIEKMESLAEGNESIYLELIAKENNNVTNYEWFKNTLQLSTNEEVDDIVVSEYVFEETKFRDNSIKIIQGIVLIMIGALMFSVFGGFREFITKNERVNTVFVRENVRIGSLSSVYGYEDVVQLYNAINIEKTYLSVLEKRENKIQSYAKWSMILIIISFIGFFISAETNTLLPVVLSFALIAVALRNLFMFFINSDSKHAYSLAEFFNIHTMQEQIRNSKRTIFELQKEVEMLRKENENKI